MQMVAWWEQKVKGNKGDVEKAEMVMTDEGVVLKKMRCQRFGEGDNMWTFTNYKYPINTFFLFFSSHYVTHQINYLFFFFLISLEV